MPVKILGDIKSNNIEISEDFIEKGGGVIDLQGSGSTVRIGSPFFAGTIYCTIGSGASISIGSEYVFYNLSIHALAAESLIEVGDKFAFNGEVSLTAHEASILRIGHNALFAGGCNLSTSDVHKIYNETGERINPAKDILIGDKVWLASHVSILKGAIIGQNSVVGTRSVVSTEFGPNSLIAGNPARLIRSGITWEQ